MRDQKNIKLSEEGLIERCYFVIKVLPKFNEA